MQQAAIVRPNPKTAIVVAQELTDLRLLPGSPNEIRSGLLIDKRPNPVQGRDKEFATVALGKTRGNDLHGEIFLRGRLPLPYTMDGSSPQFAATILVQS